jgi:hypothetical protein
VIYAVPVSIPLTEVEAPTAVGDRTVSHEKKKKVEDNQTPLIPNVFKSPFNIFSKFPTGCIMK